MESAPAFPVDDILRIMAMVPTDAAIAVVGNRSGELAAPLRDLGFEVAEEELNAEMNGSGAEWLVVWHEHGDGDPGLAEWLGKLGDGAQRGGWLFTVMHITPEAGLTLDAFLVEAERAGFKIASDVQRSETANGLLFQAAHRFLNDEQQPSA